MSVVEVVTIYDVYEYVGSDGAHKRYDSTHATRESADARVAALAWPKSMGGRAAEVTCLRVDGRMFELGSERVLREPKPQC